MKRFLVRFSIGLLLTSVYLIQSTAWASANLVNDVFQDEKESLHGVLQKSQLDPPLRDDIKRLQFSLDGKYILAQDDAGINVLTRSPFETLFRIDAPKASEAQFTPDSQNIVFHNSVLRVELWSVAEQKLKSTHNVTFTEYCGSARLSPDGRTLACIEQGTNLVLIDVETSAQIFRQNDFYASPYEGMLLSSLGLIRDDSLNRRVNMDFSADGHFFAAGILHLRQRLATDTGRVVADASKIQNPKPYDNDPNNILERSDYDIYRPGENAVSSRAVAFDLTKRKQVPLGGPLKDLMTGDFAFVSPDRVAGTNRKDRTKLTIVTFPTGEIVKEFPLEQGQLDTSRNGNYLLIRPLKNYPVGVMNLTDGSLLLANKKAALDIYGDSYVAERADGEVGLYGIAKNDLRAKVQLPRSPLTYVGAVALSPDFKLLAISGRSRAAVWDLSKGERIFFLRSFIGAHYVGDGNFYVDFPKQDSVERTFGILQTQQRQVSQGNSIGNLELASMEQYGQFFTILRRSNGNDTLNKNASLEVQDVVSMKQLWVKTFAKQRPTLWADAPNETMILGWTTSNEFAKAEIKSDSRLSKQLGAVKEKDFIYLFQILDANTGQQRGSILFDTLQNTHFVVSVFATNDSAVVLTSQSGVFVYSLSSGEKKFQIPGTYAKVSKDANLLCVVDKKSQLTIYDLATLKERDQFTFSSPVAMARFSNDGKRLFVLTTSQTAYVLDVSSSTVAPK